jgi:protein-tyrosine kinase
MSKIYEALLRAEQERIATEGKEPETTGTPRPILKPWPLHEVPLPEAELKPLDPKPFGSEAFGPEAATSEGLTAEDLGSDLFADESHTARPFVAAPLADDPIAAGYLGAKDKSSTPAFDPESVTTSVWSPSIPQLPALNDRGKSVEQFRSLRSRMHEFRDLNTLKSILVSSGLPQEGKSFIAANLAISFARHKAARVLLIDGDMRRSSLHHILGAPSEPGLAEYLAGTATISEIMHRPDHPENGPTLHHGLASLTFIGAGKDSDKAADLSGNYRFDELISQLSPHFDWIVVDSSPVNLVADGVNLARACDGVLLIARGGVTKFEVAQRALTELKASNVLGFVLNAVAKPPVTGGYYGYDSYDSYDPIRE